MPASFASVPITAAGLTLTREGISRDMRVTVIQSDPEKGAAVVMIGGDPTRRHMVLDAMTRYAKLVAPVPVIGHWTNP